MSSHQPIPPILERYEIKFTIPSRLIEPISRFVSIYCSPDKYSRRAPGQVYQVNSLYLDTPDLLFLRRRTEDAEYRFNMRIRSYGDHPQPPYFFEVKQKRPTGIRKYRAALDATDWARFVGGELDVPAPGRRSDEAANLSLFMRLMHEYGASPRVLTQYLRKAYVSDCDHYARVTFDTDLRYCVEDRYNPVPESGSMVPYDDCQNMQGEYGAVLELKCHVKTVPLWMVDLIRVFQLKRTSFSKYALSMGELLNRSSCRRHDRYSKVRMEAII